MKFRDTHTVQLDCESLIVFSTPYTCELRCINVHTVSTYRKSQITRILFHHHDTARCSDICGKFDNLTRPSRPNQVILRPNFPKLNIGIEQIVELEYHQLAANRGRIEDMNLVVDDGSPGVRSNVRYVALNVRCHGD